MSTRSPTPAEPALDGRTVVITRPAGTGSPLARRVRRMGGVPLLLPGLALRATEDPQAAAQALRAALNDQLLVFTSPAAVRFAARLATLDTRAPVFAVGQGTARALARCGVRALAPSTRQDSEGLLDHPDLQDLRNRHVALIGAPGGRGVLREQLAARGARLREVHVYRRAAPHWRRSQLDALLQLSDEARVLISSAEALAQLQQGLPVQAMARLRSAVAVVSSERLATVAHQVGFQRVCVAASALSDDLLLAAQR